MSYLSSRRRIITYCCHVITLVWEQMSVEEAIEAGSNLNLAIVPEAVVEINPSTNEIVWEWHAKDHFIQDYDDTKIIMA